RRADRAVPLGAAAGRRSRRCQRGQARPHARPRSFGLMSSEGVASVPAGVAGARQQAGQFWQARAPRERQMIVAMAAAVAVLSVWLIAVQPALRTLQETPAELD